MTIDPMTIDPYALFRLLILAAIIGFCCGLEFAAWRNQKIERDAKKGR